MAGAGSTALERTRRRLNLYMLLIPQQWISLVVLYWLHRLLSPAELVWGYPPAAILAGAALLCAVPAVLPASWFQPKSFERHLYPWLGLRAFRYLAPDGGWVNGRLRRIDPTWKVVRDAETRARHLAMSVTNERWHLSWFIFGVVAQVVAFSRGDVVWCVLLTILNVVFNLYPVMHQRHVRSRARRIRKADVSR